MKVLTMTIKLLDTEAEALERLAYINGISKDRQIASLIAKEYESTDRAACLPVYIPDKYEWALSFAKEETQAQAKKRTISDAEQAVKMLDYIIEHADEGFTAEIEEQFNKLYESLQTILEGLYYYQDNK